VTAPAAVLGRGIAFPPRVGPDGRVAFSEGERNVRESIEIILRTRERERLRLGAFGAGLDEVLFEPNTTTTRRDVRERIERALEAWEPRVAVQEVTVEADPADPESAVATIVYRLVATRAVERVTARLRLSS
jgi:phage baseplate assembly protein W